MLNVQQIKKRSGQNAVLETITSSHGNRLRRRPAAGNVDPFGQTASLLSFNVDNIRVTLAAAANSILLDRVGYRPVVVLFKALLLVFRRLFEPWDTRQLTGRCVGRAVLDRRVAVSKVAEIMDITGGK